MGILRMGPPEDLISRLQQAFKLENFVETGTYRGDTSAWAATFFNAVYTIEYSKELHEQAKAVHASLKNIHFLWGDSRSKLEELLPHLQEMLYFGSMPTGVEVKPMGRRINVL